LHTYVRIFLLSLLFVLWACSTPEEGEYNLLKDQNQKGEFIYRAKGVQNFAFKNPLHRLRSKYPWENTLVGTYPKITKEFFRCKGKILNPPNIITENVAEPLRFHDCGGFEKHSLYLKEGKEFIYPILIDLLNYVQAKTGKRVVITSGYRCPEHNSYVDPTNANKSSKHMIGAEVDFYVQGLENKSDLIIRLLMQYYNENKKYEGQKEFLVFDRYKLQDRVLITDPWCNKEIMIKLFYSSEGRNLDNRHPYPYISIQVRYDFDRKEKVTYNWNDAFRNYLRK
jgi:hypothetical protein